MRTNRWRNAERPGGELVLIADNDARHQEKAWEMLTDFAYVVLTTEDGHAAFDLFIYTQPDVILLRDNLPGRDGCPPLRSSDSAQAIALAMCDKSVDPWGYRFEIPVKSASAFCSQ